MPCRVLIVSPHLDDAVLSCGGFIHSASGVRTVTVFAGCPADGRMSTEWDRACGFGTAGEAIATRLLENQAAIGYLDAEAGYLPFCDAQYGQVASAAEIGRALRRQLKQHQPEQVLMPLGLFHSDHLLASDACLMEGRADRSGRQWIAYEDGLYRRLAGAVQRRLVAIDHRGVAATPEFLPGGEPRCKHAAVRYYASQLRALAASGHAVADECAAPERYWRLEFAGAGRA